VAAINYSFNFAPRQTVELSVCYRYPINGNNYLGSNRSELRYLLTPASYWKSFGKLTINLTLDDSQPHLMSSSLDFNKQRRGVYKFESNGLPTSELKITASSLICR